MKKLITPFLVLLFMSSIVAQTTTNDYYGSNIKPKLLSKDRVSVSLTAGTSVRFMSNSSSAGFTTFIAPKVNYQLTDKFRLNFGLIHYSTSPNTAILLNRNEGILNQSNKNISGNLVFVGGEYLLNKNVLISGAMMMDANSFSNKQNNFKAASLAIDYKVSEHTTIGIRASIEKGNQDYFYNPCRNSFDYHPTHDKYNGLFSGLATGLGEWGVGELNGLVK